MYMTTCNTNDLNQYSELARVYNENDQISVSRIDYIYNAFFDEGLFHELKISQDCMLDRNRQYSNQFKRDVHRIVNSSSFRRLGYKSQVFVNMHGDLFRNRLTHSIEVASTSKLVANLLGLNADLAEAIALAHDLGHSPFGHVGQDILNQCMLDYGGFEHNIQSLRVVDYLEYYSPSFHGLNLTYLVRDGILKHCDPSSAKAILRIAEENKDHITAKIANRILNQEDSSAEAQLVDLIDEITYVSHDIDDGLRSNILIFSQLINENQLAKLVHDMLVIKTGDISCILDACSGIDMLLTERSRHKELCFSLINYMIRHLILYFNNNKNIGLHEHVKIMFNQLKQFLYDKFYNHHSMMHSRYKAREIIKNIFIAYHSDHRLLPVSYLKLANDRHNSIERAICDYIASMTDRYAFLQYQKLYGTDQF